MLGSLIYCGKASSWVRFFALDLPLTVPEVPIWVAVSFESPFSLAAPWDALPWLAGPVPAVALLPHQESAFCLALSALTAASLTRLILRSNSYGVMTLNLLAMRSSSFFSSRRILCSSSYSASPLGPRIVVELTSESLMKLSTPSSLSPTSSSQIHPSSKS